MSSETREATIDQLKTNNQIAVNAIGIQLRELTRQCDDIGITHVEICSGTPEEIKAREDEFNRTFYDNQSKLEPIHVKDRGLKKVLYKGKLNVAEPFFSDSSIVVLPGNCPREMALVNLTTLHYNQLYNQGWIEASIVKDREKDSFNKDALKLVPAKDSHKRIRGKKSKGNKKKDMEDKKKEREKEQDTDVKDDKEKTSKRFRRFNGSPKQIKDTADALVKDLDLPLTGDKTNGTDSKDVSIHVRNELEDQFYSPANFLAFLGLLQQEPIDLSESTLKLIEKACESLKKVKCFKRVVDLKVTKDEFIDSMKSIAAYAFEIQTTLTVETVGWAVYPFLGAVNHACIPNCKATHHLLHRLDAPGSYSQTKTILLPWRPLRDGEEVTVSYDGMQAWWKGSLPWASTRYGKHRFPECLCDSCVSATKMQTLSMSDSEQEKKETPVEEPVKDPIRIQWDKATQAWTQYHCQPTGKRDLQGTFESIFDLVMMLTARPDDKTDALEALIMQLLSLTLTAALKCKWPLVPDIIDEIAGADPASSSSASTSTTTAVTMSTSIPMDSANVPLPDSTSESKTDSNGTQKKESNGTEKEKTESNGNEKSKGIKIAVSTIGKYTHDEHDKRFAWMFRRFLHLWLENKTTSKCILDIIREKVGFEAKMVMVIGLSLCCMRTVLDTALVGLFQSKTLFHDTKFSDPVFPDVMQEINARLYIALDAKDLDLANLFCQFMWIIRQVAFHPFWMDQGVYPRLGDMVAMFIVMGNEIMQMKKNQIETD